MAGAGFQAGSVEGWFLAWDVDATEAGEADWGVVVNLAVCRACLPACSRLWELSLDPW